MTELTRKQIWYRANKEILLEKRRAKRIQCACGASVDPYKLNIERHNATWTHQYYTNSLPQQTESRKTKKNEETI